MDRATLLLNHVLKSEPAAGERLGAHAGSCIRLHFSGWPDALPPWPPLAFRVTPIGLVEWCGDDTWYESEHAVGASSEPGDGAPGHDGASLLVTIDASNPALGLLQALAGERPRIAVSGDARLAADVDWLFENLRWDVDDDLARLVGPAAAREIGRLGRAIAAAMRTAAQRLGALAAAPRPGAPARQ